MTLGKQDVERQAALAAARHAGDDGELVLPQVHIHIFEVVFACTADLDRLRPLDGPQEGVSVLHAVGEHRRNLGFDEGAPGV